MSNRLATIRSEVLPREQTASSHMKDRPLPSRLGPLYHSLKYSLLATKNKSSRGCRASSRLPKLTANPALPKPTEKAENGRLETTGQICTDDVRRPIQKIPTDRAH